MNVVRPLIFVALFYIFALLQTSFLPHFAIAGHVPNLVFILFILLIFFKEEHLFFYAALAGFLLDIFFFPYIGISIAALFALWGAYKIIARILKLNQDSYHILNFAISFIMSFLLYHVILLVLSWVFRFTPIFGWNLLIGLAYNGILALIGFFVFKRFSTNEEDKNQLKLF